MITSTPDTTRQLVADRHARLAAQASPRAPSPSTRSQAPPRQWRWWAVARLLVHRT